MALGLTRQRAGGVVGARHPAGRGRVLARKGIATGYAQVVDV